MDQDYLKHLAGSSQVDEGFGSQLAARAASVGQRFSAMTGGSIQDLDTTKIKSLYLSFIKKVDSLLKDFSEGNNSVAARLLQRKDISPQQRELINKIKQMLIDLDQEIRVAQGAALRPYDPSNDTQSPPDANPYTKRSKIAELVEGFFTRDFALNKALQTNNPSVIINAYSQKLTQLLSSFTTDVSKVTKVPVDFIQRTLGKINPAYAKRYFDVRQIIDMSRPPVLPKTTPTPAPTTPSATATTPIQPPSVTAATGNSAATSMATQPPLPKSTTSNNSLATASANDFAKMVSVVMKIVIQNVKVDKTRSDPYFGGIKLATTFDEPAPHPKVAGKASAAVPASAVPPPGMIEAIGDEDTGDEGTGDEEAGDKAVDTDGADGADGDVGDKRKSSKATKIVDIPGKFLWNFGSRFNKYKKYAITFEDFGWGNVSMANGKVVKQIIVILVWDGGKNTIVVRHKNAGDTSISSKWSEIPLFEFYDDQADYRSPSFVGNKSIETYMNAASPYERPLKNADKEALNLLESKRDDFNRSLYAIVHRKSMEKKHESPDLLHLTLYKDGSVSTEDKGYSNSVKKPYDQAKLKTLINSGDAEERRRWRNSLESIGYFEEFPEMKPELQANVQAATNYLVSNTKYTSEQVEQQIINAINTIGPSSLSMSGEDLAKYVIDNNVSKDPLPSTSATTIKPKAEPVVPPPTPPPAPVTPPTPVKKSTSKVKAKYPFLDIPAARDAFLILTKLMSVGKGKKPSTRELLKTMQAVVDKEGNGLSKEQYYAKAKAEPPVEEPTATTATASPGPSPTPSVAVTNEPPTPEPPTTPATVEPTPPPTAPEPKPEENVGKVRFDKDNGFAQWTKPTGEIRKYSAKQLAKGNASKTLWKALKKAGYPFDKFGVKTDVQEDIINPFQKSNFL